jgi:hypothetical protein
MTIQNAKAAMWRNVMSVNREGKGISPALR